MQRKQLRHGNQLTKQQNKAVNLLLNLMEAMIEWQRRQ